MRDALRWGLFVGLVNALAAWMAQSFTSSTVSLFPNVLSLLLLLIATVFALRRWETRGASLPTSSQVAAFGSVAASVMALSMLIRGLVRWNSPNLPLAAVTLVSSFLVALLIVSLIATGMFAFRRRQARVDV